MSGETTPASARDTGLSARAILMSVLAVVLAAWAIWTLESARAGLTFTELREGPTPVTRISDGSNGPPVVIAHGFAGSRQMMLSYAAALAQGGYTVYSFDFEGHGRHPDPMRGDVTSIEGTTKRLVDQTLSVVEMAADGDSPVALLGHSMATDVLVRVARQDQDAVGPVVLLSAFSEAIDATQPEDLLLITGQWEGALAAFAERALQMADPDAALGQTVDTGEIRRKALLAPNVEHVAILHSRVGLEEAEAWLNAFYDRPREAHVAIQTGWPLIALLFALTVLFRPVMQIYPPAEVEVPWLNRYAFAIVVLVPAVLTPLVAYPFDLQFLPVLVADYLALHLAIYGLIQVGLLLWLKGALPRPDVTAAAILAAWAILVFGTALDRYGANFWPAPGRLSLIAALCLGAIPFMIADSYLAHGAPFWQRLLGRVAFFASLGAAVALDFEGLFFLLMIAPVLVLFYFTFGIMGRFTAKIAGPSAAGLGLGLALAWALGVSFPLFATGAG
ncbi:MAG: alpha/beta fold hydrolase [Pseudomonadota bacterium]